MSYFTGAVGLSISAVPAWASLTAWAGWEDIFRASLFESDDLVLEFPPLVVSFLNFDVVVVDLCLGIVPLNFRVAAALVVKLTLYESLPAFLNSLSGGCNGGLNVLLKFGHNSGPLCFHGGLHGGKDLLSAFSAFIASLQQLAILSLSLGEGSLVNL